MHHSRLLAALLPIILSGCYLMPYPDQRLTYRESAWGNVKREERYVLLRDFQPMPDYAALRDSSCPSVDEVGVLLKGTTIKFTGFCVRRNYWGAQPFVYGEVLDGKFAGKTFYAVGLVDVFRSYDSQRTAQIVDIRKDAVRPAR